MGMYLLDMSILFPITDSLLGRIELVTLSAFLASHLILAVYTFQGMCPKEVKNLPWCGGTPL